VDLEVVRAYNQACVALDSEARKAARERLGSNDELVREALTGLGDPDRNVRVQMLRLLSTRRCPGVVDGLLRGLADPARRVRKLAIRFSVPHVNDPAIEGALRALADDEDETPKLRSSAFQALSSGKFLSSLQDSP